MSSVKAIFFDCDGTIVDSEKAHYHAWKYALNKQGNDLTLEQYYSYLGHSTETIASRISKQLGKNCQNEIMKDKRAYFFKLLQGGISPIQPTLNFIQRLVREKGSEGYKLGVTSAAAMQEIHLHLQHLKIEGVFDIIVSGLDDLTEYHDPEGVNKPKPYIYLYASRKLHLTPQECVVIEDSSSGVEAAVVAGCFTVAVPNSYSIKQNFSRAHLKIDSFMDMNVKQFMRIIEETKQNQRFGNAR